MSEPRHGYGSAAEQGARIRAEMAAKMNANRPPQGRHLRQSGSDPRTRRSQQSERNRNSLAELQSVDASGWGRSREEAERTARIRGEQERVRQRHERRTAREKKEAERERQRDAEREARQAAKTARTRTRQPRQVVAPTQSTREDAAPPASDTDDAEDATAAPVVAAGHQDVERGPSLVEEDEEETSPDTSDDAAAEPQSHTREEVAGAAVGGAGLAATGAAVAHDGKHDSADVKDTDSKKQDKRGLFSMFSRKPAADKGEKERKPKAREIVQQPRQDGTTSAPVAAEASDSSSSEGAEPAAEPSRRRSAKRADRNAATSTLAAGAGAGAIAGAGAASAAVASHRTRVLPQGRCFPMDGVDSLALLMEGDAYQTVCFSMYLFKTELDSETLHRFFNKLVEWYPKFHYVAELDPADARKKEKAVKAGRDVPRSTSAEARQGRRTKYSKTIKAGSGTSPAMWRLSDDFKPSDNIIEVDGGCPRGKDETALYAFAGDLLSEHFDYTKPLWSALCVRGLQTSEGAKSALMIKVHHALSDGQGMIMAYHTALAALEQDAPIEAVQKHVDVRTTKGEQKKPGQRNIRPTVWGTTKHGFHTLRGLYFRSRKQFEYGPVHIEDVDDEGRRGNARAAKRFYCHSQGIPMSDIKLVRDAFSDAGLNLSLNDVACAVLTRALRVAAERTETKKVRDKRVAIFVPISKRPAGNWDMANFTTGGIAWFAFYDPKQVPYKDQLAQVNREMNRIKRSHWPNIWFSMFGGFAKRRAIFMPNYPLFKQFFERTYREYHVATNLPGPSKPVKFGEHEAYSYHVLPPSSPGKSSLSIGMISYADDFSLAVSCDGTREFAERRLAETICASFQDAAEELVEAAQEERRRMAPRRIGAGAADDEKQDPQDNAGKPSMTSRRRVFRRKEGEAAADPATTTADDSPTEKPEEVSPATAD